MLVSIGWWAGVAIGLAACTSDPATPSDPGDPPQKTPAPVAMVSVTPSRVTLRVTGSAQLTATTRDAGGHALMGRVVEWTSSSPAVATVSPTGHVLAVTPGTASVTAISELKAGTATITVTLVPVGKVSVHPDSVELHPGLSVPLTVTLEDSTGGVLVGRHVTWSSSDPSIARVDSAGLVRALAHGTAMVRATSEGYAGSAKVVVSEAPVATIAISPSPVTIEQYATTQLTAETRDSGGSLLVGRPVSWSSSIPAIATVSPDGLIEGLTPGGTTITATSGLASVAIQVTVVAQPPLVPPFTFGADVYWTDPTTSAHIEVRDGHGRRAVAGLVLRFSHYWYETDPLRQSTPLVDMGSGVVRQAGPLFEQWVTFPYRVEASINGIPVAGQAVVVAHDRPGNRTVLASDEWRLVIPQSWAQVANANLPELGRALDIGRRTVRTMMGVNYEYAYNRIAGLKPHLDWQGLAEDPRDGVCGFSGNPVMFRESCFLGDAGRPWIAAILHELGHQQQAISSLYGEISYGAGLFVEGDAQLLMHGMLEAIVHDPTVSVTTRTLVEGELASLARNASQLFQQWSQGPYEDRIGSGVWEAIGIELAGRAGGWSYLTRFTRAWQPDPVVRAMIWGDPLPHDWWVTTTTTQRATFFAAAMSAAVRQDLRSDFRSWHFPVDDALFGTLYAYWLVKMDTPAVW
ncbi:MAG TPA: Ig-like domain-containing protein [Gemmatimonadales bacterium]|nr:Ig-like domain-containing protein [Gemmatimonadales bacterium]